MARRCFHASSAKRVGLQGLALLAAAAAAMAPAAQAIPRLDLSGYPAPAPGLQRWVIQPSGLLPKSPDALMSRNPLDWRVQLIVGQEVAKDCNLKRLSGPGLSLRRLPQASGKALFELKGPVVVMSTRKACTPDQTSGRSFLALGKQPFLVPYNASWPIVVDLPKGTELRWRIWKAETRQQDAVKL
jgi:ecotin